MNLKEKISSKYVKNTIYLMSDSIIRLGVGFVLSIFVARIFGPSKFGQVNYVTAFISILQVFVLFGFDEIALKDLGLGLNKENVIIKTVVYLRISLSVLTYLIGLLIFYFFLNKELIEFYLIIGLELFLFVFYIYKQWFQIKSLNKYVVLASQTSFIALTIGKIFFLIFSNDLRIYSWLLVLSMFVEVSVLFVFYKKFKNNEQGYFDVAYAKQLIKASLPMMLKNLAIIIYMKIDQIMIGKMLTTKEVGIYSIGVTISEMLYFIPCAIANAYYPKIAEAKKNNQEYKTIIIKTGRMNVSICFMFALFCSFVVPYLIDVFYGVEYDSAGMVVRIHSWAGVFVAIGCSCSCFMIFENMQKYTFIATVLGAGINIGLNYILIPFLGINGAALTTLFSQSFSSLLFYIFMKNKDYFKLGVQCLLVFNLFRRK